MMQRQRTSTIWHTDLNDQLGWQREGRYVVSRTNGTIGHIEPGEDHENAKSFRRFLQRQHLIALGTMFLTGNTWVGPTNAKKLDYTIVPIGPHVLTHNVMERSGRRLQAIKTKSVRDHLPLYIEIYTRLDDRERSYGRPGTPRDFDHLSMGAMKGTGREQFIHRIEPMIEERESIIFQAEDKTSDKAWQGIVECIQEAAEGYLKKRVVRLDLNICCFLLHRSV